MKPRDWIVGIALMVAAAVGLGVGYVIWGWPTNWYARDVTNLAESPENDVIRYGHDLVINTAEHIGKDATDPQKRYAGNDLACVKSPVFQGPRTSLSGFLYCEKSFRTPPNRNPGLA